MLENETMSLEREEFAEDLETLIIKTIGREIDEWRKVEEELEKRLEEVLETNLPEAACVGGVDSSYLAALAQGIRKEKGLSPLKIYTAAMEEAGSKSDLPYTRQLAEFLGAEYREIFFSIKEAEQARDEIIKRLKTFSYYLTNEIPLLFCFKQARKDGVEKLMLGEGGDELFCGYPNEFRDCLRAIQLVKQDERERKFKLINERCERLAKRTYSFAAQLGKEEGLEIISPYLSPKVIELGVRINPAFKISREYEKGWKFQNKDILIRLAEKHLPREIAHRRKKAVGESSGVVILRKMADSEISDQEFEKAKRIYRRKFLDKWHYFLFKIFDSFGYKIPEPRLGRKMCLICKGGSSPNYDNCPICGYHPLWR